MPKMSARFWSIRSIVFVNVALLFIIGNGSAKGKRFDLVVPMRDFVLLEPSDPGPSGPETYAATGLAPEWNIAQWNIPGGKLSPFLVHHAGRSTILYSHAAAASVTIVRGAGAEHESARLRQDGAVLPCVDGDGKPRESDLFIGPNGQNTPLKSGMLRSGDGMPTLAEMSGLFQTVTLSARYGLAHTKKGCAVNQAGAIIGVVLSDLVASPPQTMFYQISLNSFCGPGTAERIQLCTSAHRQPAVYFPTNPFGTDDALPLAGQPFLRNGERRTVRLDLLPRLTLVIATGPAGIDRDISHWKIGGLYLGQHIWGDVTMETTWQDFRLVVGTK